jgi:DNA mismatch repair protein MutL
VPRNEVDVNAHPAKTEVRFGNAEKVRFFILSELKKQLASYGGMRSTTEIPVGGIGSGPFPKPAERSTSYAAKVGEANFFSAGARKPRTSPSRFPDSPPEARCPSPDFGQRRSEPAENIPLPGDPVCSAESTEPVVAVDGGGFSLGNAVCQIDNTYRVAENETELIIVDQHAAAERILLEKLKNDLSADSQTLLLPEMCPMSESRVELLEQHKDMMSKLGILWEKLTDDLVSVHAVPAILGACDAKALVNDLVDELAAFGDSYSAEDKIHRVLATVSCHGSLRAGRKLSVQEMNSLLRRMEKTANIAQCCHGRPSYIVFSSKNLDKFFERT